MKREASIGARVSEATTEIRIATVTLTANSRNSRPTIPPMNSRGMNAAISEKLMEITVKPISAAPLSAASTFEAPASRCRWMFSTTTMASSTMKPTAMISATRVRLLRVKPSTYIAAKLALRDTASTVATIRVADSWRRNRPITSTTRPMVSSRVSSTSCSDERMVRVRSLSTSTSMVAGSISRRRGNAAWIASAVSTMFAPGWRRITSATPGTPFGQACT